jgi:hypothetical protein
VIRRFILPGVTPSQNEWDHMHWVEKYRLRNEWFQLVRYVAGVQSPKIAHKCAVTFVRVSKRLLDPLNVPAALKPVLDAFVEFGHLRGDRAEDVIVTTDQRKCAKNEEPHMEVVIENLDGDK